MTACRYQMLCNEPAVEADPQLPEVQGMVAIHPILSAYTPAERHAIEVHKYFLGIEGGYDPTIEEAIASWERHHAFTWRSRKMRRDAEAQLREIELHRQQLTHARGQTVEFTEAARDWINHWSAQWRAYRESHPSSDV